MVVYNMRLNVFFFNVSMLVNVHQSLKDTVPNVYVACLRQLFAANVKYNHFELKFNKI